MTDWGVYKSEGLKWYRKLTFSMLNTAENVSIGSRIGRHTRNSEIYSLGALLIFTFLRGQHIKQCNIFLD